jgi:hypothetical protein
MSRVVFRMLASCGFLLYWLHVFQLLILLLMCHRSLLRLLRLLLVMRVLVFTMITVVVMDMWWLFATGRRKLKRLRLVVLHRLLVVLILDDLRGALLVQRHRSCSFYFVVLRPLRRSTTASQYSTLELTGSTQYSALTDSITASQYSTLGPSSAPSPGTYPWYLDSDAFFHMTPHFAHLSSLHPSYHHCIVHITNGSPLSVAAHGTLSSDSFYVPDVSLISDLTMQLMSTGQITDHDCCVILDPGVCYN